MGIKQLNSDGILTVGDDSSLTQSQLLDKLVKILNSNFKEIRSYAANKKFIHYLNFLGEEEAILIKNITYLGYPHRKDKKRIQISNWYKDFFEEYSNKYNKISIVGLYSFDGNEIYVDFDPEKYISREANNSSAHVNINDLSKSFQFDIFSKIDRNYNEIKIISKNVVSDYFMRKRHNKKEISDIILDFADNLPKVNITAIEAIKAMQKNDYKNWRQTEWAGWFLEYEFEKYIKDNELEVLMTFTDKKIHDYDLDLWFNQDSFYGDLKAHTDGKNDIIGNDLEVVTSVINQHGKIWYIIGKHLTIKDSEGEQTKLRTEFMNHKDNTQKPIPRRKIKKAVRFEELLILEINEYNSHLLGEFQKNFKNSDGNLRKEKITITNKMIKDDSFIIGRRKVS